MPKLVDPPPWRLWSRQDLERRRVARLLEQEAEAAADRGDQDLAAALADAAHVAGLLAGLGGPPAPPEPPRPPTLADRIAAAVADGPRTYREIAQALGAREVVVRATVARDAALFTRQRGPDGLVRVGGRKTEPSPAVYPPPARAHTVANSQASEGDSR